MREVFLGTWRWLAVSLLTLAMASSAIGQDYHRYYYKEKRVLRLEEARIGVYNTNGLPPEAVEGYLHSVGLQDFSMHAVIDRWFLLERSLEASQSGQPIAQIIDTVSRRPDNPHFLTPIFGDDETDLIAPTPRILVQFEADLLRGEIGDILSSVGAGRIEVEHWAGMQNALITMPRVASGFKVLEIANQLAEMPEVLWAEPDFMASAEPTGCSPVTEEFDPDYSKSWGLEQDSDIDLDAEKAWETCGGDASVPVVVFDTGIQQDHPDINQLPGADFTDQGCPEGCGDGGASHPCENHGTAVAGVISQRINNFYGSVGIAPNAKVISAKIGRGYYSGQEPNQECRYVVLSSWVANGISWAAYIAGGRITNTSFRLLSSSAVSTELQETRTLGVVHFAAAGNANAEAIDFPASNIAANAVSAISSDGTRWVDSPTFGSNYGDITPSPGDEIYISAPGGGIFTTDRTGSDGYDPSDHVIISGTSFATPFVAGTMALILSVEPNLTAQEAESILCGSAEDRGAAGWDPVFGCGLVNAGNAMKSAIEWVFSDGFESGDTSHWSIVTP